jgi:hypothetical protein
MISFCNLYCAYFSAIALLFAMFALMMMAFFWCVSTAVDNYMALRTLGRAFRRVLFEEAQKQSKNEAIVQMAINDPREAEKLMGEDEKHDG